MAKYYYTPRPDKRARRRQLILRVGIAIGILAMLIWLIYPIATRPNVKQVTQQTLNQLGPGKCVSYPGKTFNYATRFNSVNATHLKVAKKKGLSQIPLTREDVPNMKNQLKRVTTTSNYQLDELSHSMPYLRPYALDELNRIGEEFASILERNNLPHYRFIVTSVLRTQEDVKNLQRSGNVNSTTNSAHCYGTTFDITYVRYDKYDLRNPDYMMEGNLALVLAQALLNEQRADRIYVRYEKKQACFHITCR